MAKKKKTGWIIFVLVLLAALAAVAIYYNCEEPVEEVEEEVEVNELREPNKIMLHGVIGDIYYIKMRFDTGPFVQAVYQYINTKTLEPKSDALYLKEVAEDKQVGENIVLAEYDEFGEETARFHGLYQDGVFQGVYENNQDEIYGFRLVPEDVDIALPDEPSQPIDPVLAVYGKEKVDWAPYVTRRFAAYAYFSGDCDAIYQSQEGYCYDREPIVEKSPESDYIFFVYSINESTDPNYIVFVAMEENVWKIDNLLSLTEALAEKGFFFLISDPSMKYQFMFDYARPPQSYLVYDEDAYDFSEENMAAARSVPEIVPELPKLLEPIVIPEELDSEYEDLGELEEIVMDENFFGDADAEDLSQVLDEDDTIYEEVELSPEFPGGAAKLLQYLRENIIYPQDCKQQGIQGRVMVRLAVGKDGSVSHVTVAQSINPKLDREAVRVVSSMPKWKPGERLGKPVNSWTTIPVQFRAY